MPDSKPAKVLSWCDFSACAAAVEPDRSSERFKTCAFFAQSPAETAEYQFVLTHPKSRFRAVVVAGVWLVALGGSFAALAWYAAAAGAAHAPTAEVSQALMPYRQPGRALAVMTIHPKCPCTTASLAEFGDLLARAGSSCDGLLVQFVPAAAGDDWLPDAARTLGGRTVPVVADSGGRLAAILGAQTSGHVVLVDATGEVRFHGGITLSRGHRGRSPGQDAMLAAVAPGHAPVELCSAPVYGCALHEPGSTTTEVTP